MSLHSYVISRELSRADRPFSSYIMAAMRKADTYNEVKLRAAFPEIWDELQARHDAPMGALPGEHPTEEWIEAAAREARVR